MILARHLKSFTKVAAVVLYSTMLPLGSRVLAADAPEGSAELGVGVTGSTAGNRAATPLAIPVKPTTEPGAATSPPKTDTYYAGIGLSYPEMLPLEGLVRFRDRRFGARFFLSPPVKIMAREAVDAEQETYFNSVIVATPATNVDVKATLGPMIGGEFLYFPTPERGLFFGSGLAYYQMRGEVHKTTGVLLCYDVTTSCGVNTASFQTNSQLDIDATGAVHGLKARLSFGWLWDVGNTAFVSLAGIGLDKTIYSKRQISSSSSMPSDPGLSQIANDQIQYVLPSKEARVKSKVNNEMNRVDRAITPVIGMTAGLRF